MKNYPQIGVQIPDVLLPSKGTDLSKWAVIACDQFTSEPEYWQQVEKFVGNSPSTYNLTLPEVFLGKPEEIERIRLVQDNMRQYVSKGLFTTHEGMILVERSVAGKVRYGLVLALDLERYDFSKGSQSLIRATEGTIIERLPPRMKIREGALLEFPHILVLIDDPHRTVIEPLVQKRASLNKLYDFELMLGSGHVKGYSVAEPALESEVIRGFTQLADPARFASRYNVGSDQGVLLFAMGDGNHSLATAKAIWEKNKDKVGMDHPSRYALVEIENVHDDGLEFEPIHRVLFGVKADLEAALSDFFSGRIRFERCKDDNDMVHTVDRQPLREQAIGIIAPSGCSVAYISKPPSNLPVGTLQQFLDHWQKAGGYEKIDYVHGEEVTCRLGRNPGNLGFYVPSMDKSDLFKTVILDGALPRKTFSMGEAKEKRFYIEGRQIA